MNIEKLEEHLKKIENLSDKEWQDWYNTLPQIPYGWVDIKEHLPSVYVGDYLKQGYSVFKVRMSMEK